MRLWYVATLIIVERWLSLPRCAVTSLQDLLVGGLEEAIGHLVAVAVRLGQVHQVDLALVVAVTLQRAEALQHLWKKENTSNL